MKTATITPAIMNSKFIRTTPAAQRYWNALAKRMAGRVDVIDPVRLPLKDLRNIPTLVGLTVYRASTGGKWGKSAQIVTL